MLKLLDAAVVLKKWTIVNKIVTKRMEKKLTLFGKKIGWNFNFGPND